MKTWLIVLGVLAGLAGPVAAQAPLDHDRLPTSAGEVQITPVGHGSLYFTWAGKVVHVDPWGKLADYRRLPRADLILVTHEHPDHFDPAAMRALGTTNTVVMGNAASMARWPGGRVMTNGQVQTVAEVRVEAVPAYNRVHMREDGQPYHPRGAGNGYLLTFADQRVYVAGDTENTPEMKALTNLAVAFLPMNLPYTMTPEMVADAVQAMRPRIFYPYHYGETDPARLAPLLRSVPGVDVRIRKFQ